MLGQSTLISNHTEANGCIFFATGVGSTSLLSNNIFVKATFLGQRLAHIEEKKKSRFHYITSEKIWLAESSGSRFGNNKIVSDFDSGEFL